MTTPVDARPQSAEERHTAAIVAAYLAATGALRARLLALVATMYASQGDYRDAAAAGFVVAVVPTVLAAQQAMGSLTTAYLGHLISTGAGGTTAPTAIPLDAFAGLRGVDPAEVYRRPYEQVWTALADGKDFPTAVEAGARRAQSLAATDLQLAKTHTSRIVMQHDDRVTGYRRVLNGPYSCALCVLASTRWYSRGDLSPIHNMCDCSVAPLFGGEQPSALPAEQIHEAVARDLGEKYVTAAGKGPIDYRSIVVTHDHGEIGPVLTVRGHQWAGPSDLPGGK